jgi:hypothetical protein
MTYLYEELLAPTRLYIKQCSHCDLKYFGKTILEDIQSYEGSGIRWQRHLKKHNAESVHLWNSDWYYDTSIVRFATKFSNINKIVESKNWANLAIENGIDGGYLGEYASTRISEGVKRVRSNPEWKDTVGKEATRKATGARNKTMSNPEWKDTVGKESTRKRLETMSNEEWKETVGKRRNSKAASSISKKRLDPEWKDTVGKESTRKRLETVKDPSWQETVGAAAREKISKTRSDPNWKETIGKEAKEKELRTKSSTDWKNTVGKQAAIKCGETQKSNEWKLENHKVCPYCFKGPFAPGMFSRWHDKNCKEYNENV